MINALFSGWIERFEFLMNGEKTFSALRVRDFRYFWISQIISLSGTWMQQVAIGWLVYSLTKSPFYLGLTTALMSAPIMVFTLLGGITADRYPKKTIIIFTQSLLIIPAFLLGLLSGLGHIAIWHIFVIVIFIGLVNAFDTPARQSYLVEIVGKGNLLNAIALNSAAFNGARIVGPMIAGILIAKLGVNSCFYLNALSFIPVIVVLFLIKEQGTGEVTGRESILKDLGDGLRYIRGERDILFLFAVITSISLFGIPYSSFLPVIAEDILRTGAKGLGRLASAAGAGAFLAAMIIAIRGGIKNRFYYMAAALISASVSILLLTWSRTESYSLALLFFAGWGIVSFLALANNFIQQTAPDSLRGRVMSVYILVFLGMSPLGNVFVGLLAHSVGTMNALRIAALVCLITTAVFIKYESPAQIVGAE
jgi:MFS family permease